MKKNKMQINTSFFNNVHDKINNVIFVLETPQNFIKEYNCEEVYSFNHSLLIKNEVKKENRNDYIVYINIYKCGVNIKNLEKAYIQALGRIALIELEEEVNPINELLKGWQIIETLNLNSKISKEEFFEDIKYLLIENSQNKRLNITL